MANPPGNPPPLARRWLYLGWAALLVLLTLVFGNFEERRRNPNSQPESHVSDAGQQQVVLQRNRSGHYVVTGTINGTPVTFLLDTGATTVAIPENLARQLGLKKMARGQASTANGVVEIYFTRLDSVSIGGIQVRDVRASINPGMNHDDTVLLGMSVLKDVEFRQQGDRLTLVQVR